jgi:predicted DNA-binding ribbon-helix-helix protein
VRSLIKRSFSLAGHRTSVALEPEFWDALGDIARSRGQLLVDLVVTVDGARDGGTPLASSLRVLALRCARDQYEEIGDPDLTEITRDAAPTHDK